MLHSIYKHTVRQGLARRWASTNPSSAAHAFVRAKRSLKTQPFYQQHWLSDPATYPLIATMGIAIFLVTGVATSCIFYNPDVQIHPEIRGSVLRRDSEWSESRK